MATTSFLYHSFGLVGYDHQRTEFINGWTYFHVSLKEHQRQCRNCGAKWHDLKKDGTFERTFFAVPCGLRPQFLVLRGHRQKCLKCQKIQREPIHFVQGQKRYLKRFARYVAIDEFAVQKGHRYMTIVMDLETGEILHAQEGKGADSVEGFLRKLKKVAQLKAIAADMSGAYKKAVALVFGKEFDLVHDPFHVVALASKAIDETRRDLAREAAADAKRVIKGSRFLLLGAMENLSERGLERLVELMEFNRPLYRAYLLKEDLRTFWSISGSKAETFLNNWLEQARSLGNRHFSKLADTLEEHRDGLLCYFKHKISTGPLEGLNNKIKVLKRMAYGYRDHVYFKLRLYDLHEDSPAVFR